CTGSSSTLPSTQISTPSTVCPPAPAGNSVPARVDGNPCVFGVASLSAPRPTSLGSIDP
ncbi:hypothetical protein BJV77DRAFT_1015705, partial [Russula vinacea]